MVEFGESQGVNPKPAEIVDLIDLRIERPRKVDYEINARLIRARS
jgi:hypothetical protein